MKKLIYSFAILALVFTSCNPMEDIYEELDATQENIITGEASYTLTDGDYDDLDLSYGNFGSIDDAKTELPAFLSNKYPVWGAGSLVNVTFKLYHKKNDEKSLTVYEVTSQDYADNGHNYGNFSSQDDITDFLNVKFPNAAHRELVSLTYKYYSSGSVKTLNDGFILVDGVWEKSLGFTDEDYEAMGESFPNFSFEDEAFQKIPIYLKEKFKYDDKQAGDIEGIMYKLYVTDVDDVDGDGRTDDRTTYSYVAFFIYDGMNWSKYENVIDESIKFGHDGNTWVPDNTIKYTLTSADYALVGNDRYGNFDVRAGRDEADEQVRVDKISTILLHNFPNDEEGQKYIVTYNIYNGANGVWTLAVIKQGGAYVKQ